MANLAGRTTQANISGAILKRHEVLLPPLAEQRRIAEILTSVDDAIQATRTVCDQTRKVKQGLLQRLMTRGIGHTKFKMTEIGEVPEGWELRRISDLGEVLGGRQRSPHIQRGTARPYLRVANVYDGFLKTDDVNSMLFSDEEFERYRLAPGDILLNEGQSIELVGRSAIYQGDPSDCCFQNTLIRFRASVSTDSRYAQALFCRLQYAGVFSAIATKTTTIAHLGVNRFASLRVATPPLAEQRRIAEVITGIDDAVVGLRHSLDQQEGLKSGLMSDLLTGRIRVGGVA